MYKVLFFLFLGQLAYSQSSNLVIGSEALEPFLLSLDGEAINTQPQTQVRVDGIAPGMHKVNLQVVQKNGYSVYFRTNVFLETNTECYYTLKRNNKNQYVLRLYNMVEIQQPMNNLLTNQIPNSNQYPNTQTQTNQQPVNIVPPGGNNNTNVVNPQININIGGSQTTPSPNQTIPVVPGGTTVITTPPVNPLPGYNGPIGCPVPASDATVAEIKRTIQNTTFESSKLSIAKQIVGSNCLLSRDVKEIMELFTYESSKLEFAKFAYGRTYDLGNYFIVNQAFGYESSISDLDRFIRSKGR